eukprot:GABV01000623.1.p1 GENE.GABV01000623.1~~GABV01000623.1.p1  ORF type:complete len:366 (-),score=57.16 GABV01000623.1:13-1110(-)
MLKILSVLALFLSSVSWGFDVPPHCVKFNDGCHECEVVNGELTACTEQACFVENPSYCMAFEPGFENECQDMCIELWEPLCAKTTGGKAEKTFGNLCEMQSWLCHHASTEMNVIEFGQTCEDHDSHQGPHIPELDGPDNEDCWEACAMIYDPVCGSDGVTYGNACELSNIQRCVPGKQSLATAYVGACAPGVPEDGVGIQHEPDNASCNQVCAEIYQPVCGSNAQTYSNPCELQRAACFSRNAIRFQHEGPCEDVELPGEIPEEDCNRFCTREWAPVCGTDGVTRGNACELAVASCLAQSRHFAPLTLKHTGECTPEDVVVPQGCELFFDGCHECVISREDGSMACTKNICETTSEPECRSYFQN